MKNLGLKVLSISIALVLYLFVHSQTNSSVIALVVPVELQNLPPEKIVLLPTLRQAQVSIKGPSFLIREIAISAPSFKVRVPKDVGERFKINLNSEELPLPAAVDIVSVEPPEMELILDDLITKNVRVEVPRIGELEESLRLTDLQVSPASVEIVGAMTELKGIESVETAPLDLRTITGNSQVVLGLRSVGKYGRLTVDRVNVKVATASISAEKIFEKLPVEVRSKHARSFTVNPSFVDVEVTGPRSAVKALDSKALVPYVRLEDGDNSDTSKMVNVDLPQGLAVIAIKPEKVKLVVSR